MKKCLLISFALLYPFLIFSQCTPSNNTVPGAIPSIADNLPIAYTGNYYGTTIQVRTPLDTTVNGTYAKLTEIQITGIGNMPPGFTYACNPSNCTLGPLSNGCLQITGNPTQSIAGNYLLDINITVKGKLYGVIPVTQQTKLADYKIKVAGPPVANFFASQSNICPNETVTFTDNSTNYPTSYKWTFTGGNPATSTLENPVVTYSTPGNYTVKLEASSPAGKGTKIKTGIIHVNASPTASLFSYNNDTVCAGDSFRVKAVQVNNASYKWHKNGSPISGATDYFYYAKSAGDYSVRITQTTTGCSAVSNTKNIHVVNLNASLTAVGSASVCMPQKVSLAAHVNSNFTYKWFRNGNVINGANTSSYLAALSGNYKVKVENKRGCTKFSSALPVAINSKPTAVISTTDPTTFCAGSSAILAANVLQNTANYKWFKNNNLISGATSRKYTATQQGYYTSKVTNQYGCSTISNRIRINVNCRMEGAYPTTSDISLLARLNPNPAADNAVLSFSINESDRITISIYDAIGKMKMTLSPAYYTAGDHEIYLNTSSLSSGIYYVKVNTETENKTLKLIIQ